MPKKQKSTQPPDLSSALRGMLRAYGHLHDEISQLVEQPGVLDMLDQATKDRIVGLLAGSCLTATHQARSALRHTKVHPIYLEVNGGSVVEVYADLPRARVLVIDHDNAEHDDTIKSRNCELLKQAEQLQTHIIR